MSAAAHLAAPAAHTDWAALPAEVQAQAADLVLDTLAVIAAGGAEASHARFAQQSVIGNGSCTVIGRSARSGEAAAALANGSATTVLQLQDGHRIARGHPASHVLPAALAAAEAHGSSGLQFLSAFVAGYEVCTRIGAALGGMRPEIHDAGTWGTVGAAVAATWLRTTDAALIARAIEGSASVAMLPWSQPAPQGAGMHHLTIGLAASMGITVAHAALAGLEDIPGTLEAFFGPRAGAAFDAKVLVAGIENGRWSRYELMNAYIKRHPTCAHLHGINDATLDLIHTHGVRGTDVATIEVASYGHGLAYDNPMPHTALAARFSVKASTAIALHLGELSAHGICVENLQHSAVQSLMQRATVKHDPALDAQYPAGRPARVTLQLHDGRTLTASCMHPRGDAANPMPRSERRSKALALLALRFGQAGAQAVVDALDRVLQGAPLAALSAALQAQASPAAAQ